MNRSSTTVFAVALTVLATAGPAFAQTTVSSGDITTTTWTAAGSPYLVTGDVRIPEGETLTIEEGVTVEVSNIAPAGAGEDPLLTEILVEGALSGVGAAGAGIDFSGPGWGGFVVESTGTLDLVHATIDARVLSYATGDTPNMEHVSIATEGYGFEAWSGQATLTDVDLHTGVHLDGSASPTLLRVFIEPGEAAVHLEPDQPANIVLDGVTLYNGRLAVDRDLGSAGSTYVLRNSIVIGRLDDYPHKTYCIGTPSSGHPELTVENNLFYHCTHRFDEPGQFEEGVSQDPDAMLGPNYQLTQYSPGRFGGTEGQDLGARPYDGTPSSELKGVLWEDLTLGPGVVEAGPLTVSDRAKLTLPPGTTYRTADGLIVEGGLHAVGTEAEPITFRSQGNDPEFHLTIRAGASLLELTHADLRECLSTGCIDYEADLSLTWEHLTTNAPVHFTGGGHQIIRHVVWGGLSLLGSTSADIERSVLKGLTLDSLAEEPVTANQVTLWGTLSANSQAIVRNSIWLPTSPTATTRNNVDLAYALVNYPQAPWISDTIYTGPVMLTADYVPMHTSGARFRGDEGQDLGAYPYVGDQTVGLAGILWDGTVGPGDLELTGNVWVPEDQTLTIEPGTRIISADPYRNDKFLVYGSLFASGTELEPIELEKTGIYIGPDSAGSSIRHLVFKDAKVALEHESSDTTVLRDVRIENADTAVLAKNGRIVATRLQVIGGTTAFELNVAELDIDHCLVDKPYTIAWFRLLDGRADFDHCTFLHRSSSTYEVYKGSPRYPAYTKFRNGIASETGPMAVSYSNVWDADEVPAGTGNLSEDPLFVSDDVYRLTHRSPSRFGSEDGSDQGAFPYDGDLTPGLVGVSWEDETLSGDVRVGSLRVPEGVTLTVAPGSTVRSESSQDRLDVFGRLEIIGTPESPVWSWMPFNLQPGSTASFRYLTGSFRGTIDTEELVEMRDLALDQIHLEVLAGIHRMSNLQSSGTARLSMIDARLEVENCATSNQTFLTLEGSGEFLSRFCTFRQDRYQGRMIDFGDDPTGYARFESSILFSPDWWNDLYSWEDPIEFERAVISKISTWADPPEGVVEARSIVDARLVPLPDSPAIDAGDPDDFPALDVRGRARPNPMTGGDALPDIGGVEFYENNAGLVVTELDTVTSEGGDSAAFEVSLASPPFDTVTIKATVTKPTEGELREYEFVFSSATWDIPQTVWVDGLDDFLDDGDIEYRVTLSASESLDIDYQELSNTQINLLSEDDDVSALVVDPIDGLTTSEAGATATFTVHLATQPYDNVRLDLFETDSTEGRVSPLSLSFTPDDWHEPREVTLIGVNDGVDDGDEPWQVEIDPALSADDQYAALGVAVVSATNLALVPGVAFASSTRTVRESGSTATISFRLDAAPTASVTIPFASTDTTEGTVSVSALVFTTANWDTEQFVTVTGVDDDVDDGDMQFDLAIGPLTSSDGAYGGLDPEDIRFTNQDDDEAAIEVTTGTLAVAESGTTSTLSIVLGARPTHTVTVPVSASDATEGRVTPAVLTFQPNTWSTPQTVTIEGVDDDIADGDVDWTVQVGPATTDDTVYGALEAQTFDATTTDDDEAVFRVDVTTVTVNETGSIAIVGVTLGAEPAADVVVAVSITDPSEATVDTSSLTFTPSNWHSPQALTITGVDDEESDGDVTWTLRIGPATGSPEYTGAAALEIPGTTRDDEVRQVWVTPTEGLQTIEDGTIDTFEVVLSLPPSDDVTVPIASDDPTEGEPDTTELIFTPSDWDTPQLVTITGIDDTDTDGAITYTIEVGPAESSDLLYDGIEAPDVVVTNLDDEGPGIRLDTGNGAVVSESGTEDSVSIVLAYPPTHPVRVRALSQDPDEVVASPAELTFAVDGWDTPQSLHLVPGDDDLADGDQEITLTLTAESDDEGYDALPGPNLLVFVEDDEFAEISVLPWRDLETSEDGGTDSFSISISAKPASEVILSIRSSNPTEGTVDPEQIVFGPANWQTTFDVTVTGLDDAWEDGDVLWTAELLPAWSADPAWNQLDPSDVSIVNLDDDGIGRRPSGSRPGLLTPNEDDDDDTDPPGRPGSDTLEPGLRSCQHGPAAPPWLLLALLPLARRRSTSRVPRPPRRGPTSPTGRAADPRV